ncbi:flagellar biosynthesis protein FlhB [Kurthia sibirica]|uniref:Flagellar biosynthetic protein FlhB n=1 Tax=Kurthia sibirica TaxID=202750 RepID=A0A2U3AQU5_9BACL|nr:flagellar biosynthesis protein FlhB [Kurthia sibirica]PWI26911.1 flagellar biosynthesis protein FlhB [Kurthia sibirica]GEK32547.1 flagellar biosynthetic protein FlhB [Kurthia sibirica]
MLVTLNLQFFAGEKTEKATPKKRQDARKKGQVLKSQDVTSAIVLFAVFMYLFFAGPSMRERLLSFFRETLSHNILIETLSISSVVEMYKDIMFEVAVVLLPIMLTAVVAAVAANFFQFGLLFTVEPLKFDLKKIDPIKGFKRIFSMKAIIELIKSILKISFIGTVTTMIIFLNIEDVLSLSFKTPGDTLTTIAKLAAIMGLSASVVLLIISILDYFYQRFDYEKNLKMSKQDVKDEYKNSEGDPLIKSKIKQRQREMAMRRMMQEIPHADVVITNPTHYAIALKYDDSKMAAPVVVAKGTDFVAQKIKLIAKENGVVMVENRPLARAMYDQVQINQKIPDEFFKAVAEVLAYVYRIKRKI